jgi:cystathionine beta-lyase/cystathionine gamma-synthase
MPETSAQSVVPNFESVDELREGLAHKSRFAAVDLYPRDGSVLLGEVERRISQLAGVNEDQLVTYGSGMAAVTEAIDIGLERASNREPVVASASELYSQTKRFLDCHLQSIRAKVVYFDSGDNAEIERVFTKYRPDVVVAETIGNFVNVPVADTDFLLKQTRQAENRPTLVLDHTLPLSTGLAVADQLRTDDNIIVVESGTKSYSFNAELLGIGYSKHPQLINAMQRYRRTRGTVPSSRALDFINQVLPEDRETFNERNQRLFRNTGHIALRLAELADGNTDFLISHPGLPSHDNHDFYSKRYPEQATPIFYVQSAKYCQYEVAERLWAHPGVRDQAQLGQSFGFDHTRIVADENVGAVRVAGGAETDGRLLGEACAEALYGRSH